MVSRKRVAVFVRLGVDLRLVVERCGMAKMIPVRVKGEGVLLSVLLRDVGILDMLSQDMPKLAAIRNQVNRWAQYLDKTYPKKPPVIWNPMLNLTLPQPKVDLELADAARLEKECKGWLEILLRELDNPGTAILSNESLDAIFPDDLLEGLDDATRADLADGVESILNLVPTPAAMFLFRVGENVVRGLYRDIVGCDPSTLSWGEMLQALEESRKLRKPLLGYLDYLRDKRNEAEHPDKRFTQEESERILLQVKGLIEEVRATTNRMRQGGKVPHHR